MTARSRRSAGRSRCVISSKTTRSAEILSAYTSRVLVHGLESKSRAAGFDSSAVCFARFRAGRRVATEPLGDAQPFGTAPFEARIGARVMTTWV